MSNLWDVTSPKGLSKDIISPSEILTPSHMKLTFIFNIEKFYMCFSSRGYLFLVKENVFAFMQIVDFDTILLFCYCSYWYNWIRLFICMYLLSFCIYLQPDGVPVFKVYVRPKVGGLWIPCGDLAGDSRATSLVNAWMSGMLIYLNCWIKCSNLITLEVMSMRFSIWVIVSKVTCIWYEK